MISSAIWSSTKTLHKPLSAKERDQKSLFYKGEGLLAKLEKCCRKFPPSNGRRYRRSGEKA
jgi:hypothetical protein|tara:strand:- start:118 stop:300 length:183 start_codon:yes stop_codon:yes gene_type:complete